ncbi:MurR/RpiR family transcriptional regulator [uncultured Thomasclavelia sp.]|uniref:MurR/RpiR family transcriptional regulator n=1 Tax=uncultured Thomasclavelia sp. TaxID=3025759 RepID=UPI0025CBD153|nr:MurR/RpiR family transcriptional regulator [uncultured Thomasclavelia sp.]
MRGAFYNLINFINTTNINDVYANAARIILKNIFLIPECTITDVADLCFVSTATISRLCRKLNYESFADFKTDVTMNLNYFNRDTLRLQFDHQLPERKYLHRGKEVFKAHFDNILNNLQTTYDTVAYEDLEFIVDKIHDANRVCFAGNFFTQSVSMQLQIELSYLGKECSGMYPLQQQVLAIESLNENDVIIVSSIAGGFMVDHPNVMRIISKSTAYKIVITQLDKFAYSDKMDMILKVGTDHHSLIGKFSITYIFEVLEALYHLKYGNKTNQQK